MNNSPIGVFDSGMGGLSVWREMRRAMPSESLVYYGDGENCPYGEKDPAQVLGLVEQGVRALLGEGVKMVVLACNTATVAAIGYLRDRYQVPFVGMEPAVKPAAATTESGVVGVLATRSTLDSDWFRDVRERYADKARIITAEGRGFVRIVESGQEDSPEAEAVVSEALKPLLEAGADRIVLGCTHYPFLGRCIRQAAGPHVEIIDPAPAIVRRVEWLLDERDMRAEADNVARYRFLTASDEHYLARLHQKAFAE